MSRYLMKSGKEKTEVDLLFYFIEFMGLQDDYKIFKENRIEKEILSE